MSNSKGKVGSLFWGMTLDTNDFKKKVKNIKKDMAKFGKQMKADLSAIAGGFKVVAAGVTGVAAGLIFLSKNTSENINRQKILADSIGTTQSKIAGLELSTKKWGVETNMVIDKMREAGGFNKFSEMADQVKGAGNETDQLTKSIELFGNEGAKMLPLLQQGSAGLRNMEIQALALGHALDPKGVAMSTLAWAEFENVMMRIQGLGTQIGAAFAKPFAKISNSLNAFLGTFDTEIKGFFQKISDGLVSIIDFGLEKFMKFGIPAFNSMISFANSIGEAFENLFSFLTPAANSAFGGIGKLFEGLMAFLATIKESIGIGISKSIQVVLKGAFNGLAKLAEFIGNVLGPVMTGLSEAGLVSENFSMGFAESMEDQRIELRRMGKELSKPFEAAEKEFFNNMVNKLTAIELKNDADQKKFNSYINGLQVKIDSIEKGETAKAKQAKNSSGPKTSVEIKDFAGLALAGSVEAFRAENAKGRTVEITQKQLRELQKLNKTFDNMRTV